MSSVDKNILPLPIEKIAKLVIDQLGTSSCEDWLSIFFMKKLNVFLEIISFMYQTSLHEI